MGTSRLKCPEIVASPRRTLSTKPRVTDPNVL